MKNTIQQKTDKIINNKSTAISAEISSKLNQARQKATNTQSKKHFFSAFIYVPTVAVLLLAFYFIMPLSQKSSIQNTADDLMVISEINQIELIEQIELIDDIEFYQWLSAEDDVQI